MQQSKKRQKITFLDLKKVKNVKTRKSNDM